MQCRTNRAFRVKLSVYDLVLQVSEDICLIKKSASWAELSGERYSQDMSNNKKFCEGLTPADVHVFQYM
jgi:hypothetical protein